MSVKLLTEHHFEQLNLKAGCTGSSESTIVKIPHCWKSHVAAHLIELEAHTAPAQHDPDQANVTRVYIRETW